MGVAPAAHPGPDDRPVTATPGPKMDHTERFERLDGLLVELAWLWRPVPFRERRPAWCTRLPALAADALALDEPTLERLIADDAARAAWLRPHLPALAELRALASFPPASAPAAHADARLACEVPGRKLAQIEAFSAGVGSPRAPLLEWCAGKGHLGRLLAAQAGVEVLSLEREAHLCAAGARLAARARVDQRFLALDVVRVPCASLLAERHAVALHACGQLHRVLLESAAGARARALDLAPCCYHKVPDAEAAQLSGRGALRLGLDELRLAVADTATAPAAEIRLRRREMAWKLGFDLLQREVRGVDAYRALVGVPDAWLRGDFEAFCRLAARRQGLDLPGDIDWSGYEAAGGARSAEAQRLGLVRGAFRRALEAWLVLDRTLFLQARGYAVRIEQFCPPRLTPRNLLISARL